MKVLFVNRHDSFDRMGGDTIQMTKTAHYLKQAGVDVNIAIGPQDLSTYEQYEIIHIFNLQTSLFTSTEIVKAKRANCKIVLSPIWWDFRADEILRDSKKWRSVRKILGTYLARKVLTARINRVFHSSLEIYKDILCACDAILPNSIAELEAVRSLCDYKAKEYIVFNGVDPGEDVDLIEAKSLLAKHGIPENGYIMIAARVEPVKNQLGYIHSVQALRIPVLCVGAINQGYGDQCHSAGALLVGQLEAPVLNGLYALCRIHALPSLRETPGLASLEAALFGAPVITTNIGSAPEYFVRYAEYLDPHEPRSMRGATIRALKRPRSTELRSYILERFTWERAAYSTLEAYNALLKSHSRLSC